MSSMWIKKEERLSFTGGKVCLFGGQGTGKSTVAGTFPRINLVDAEDGQTYYLADNDNILNVLPTTSAADVQKALDELNDESMLSSYDTVVIDSGTKLYENMQAAAYEIVENRAKKQRFKGRDIDLDDLNLSQRDWGHIRRWNQQLATTYILMSNMGKWTVVTAHEREITKDIKKANGETEKVVIGYRPDLARKAEHDFDILLRTFNEKDPKTGEMRFFAEVYKDRTNVTKIGQIIENPTFEIWREKWESTRKHGVKKIDMSSDVKSSMKVMESEDDELANIIKDFKVKMKALDKTEQAKVAKKLTDLKITNPLRTNDLIGMRQVIEFIDLL
jgi:hypothetical protein